MRKIPEYSSDIFYSSHFKVDDIIELCKALGYSDVKYITTATISPQRLLYHTCLNAVQTYLVVRSHGESERSCEIEELANKMYSSVLQGFETMLLLHSSELESKKAKAALFIERMEGYENGLSYDENRFRNTWNLELYHDKWQKKAAETYGIIKSRISSGEYALRPTDSIGSLTLYWSERNLEYKHYRDIARKLTTEYIANNIPPENQLDMHDIDSRYMAIVFGGIGSGKSSFSEDLLEKLPSWIGEDIILHDADYLKTAIYNSARQDGAFPTDYQYHGSEVQAESSNALYEGTRKRTYLLATDMLAPHTLLNNIVLGKFELDEGTVNGGNIFAYHIYMKPSEAIEESHKREEKGGRRIEASDIKWSARASASSILSLTENRYYKTNITVHLYNRKAGEKAKHYATINLASEQVTIYDIQALSELCSEIYPEKNPQQALESFLFHFSDKGYAITSRDILKLDYVALNNEHIVLPSSIAILSQGQNPNARNEPCI